MKINVIFALLVGLSLALSMPGGAASRSEQVSHRETVPPADETEAAHPEVSRITAEELKQLMDKKGECVLVDTRDSPTYDQGHIKGAVNIYYNPIGDPIAREMMLMALPMDKLIIFYCS